MLRVLLVLAYAIFAVDANNNTTTNSTDQSTATTTTTVASSSNSSSGNSTATTTTTLAVTTTTTVASGNATATTTTTLAATTTTAAASGNATATTTTVAAATATTTVAAQTSGGNTTEGGAGGNHTHGNHSHGNATVEEGATDKAVKATMDITLDVAATAVDTCRKATTFANTGLIVNTILVKGIMEDILGVGMPKFCAVDADDQCSTPAGDAGCICGGVAPTITGLDNLDSAKVTYNSANRLYSMNDACFSDTAAAGAGNSTNSTRKLASHATASIQTVDNIGMVKKSTTDLDATAVAAEVTAETSGDAGKANYLQAVTDVTTAMAVGGAQLAALGLPAAADSSNNVDQASMLGKPDADTTALTAMTTEVATSSAAILTAAANPTITSSAEVDNSIAGGSSSGGSTSGASTIGLGLLSVIGALMMM